ncbi:MAG TPA: Fic family protein [Candidatus Limnocylindria bacterium]|jgi:Fic family protein|nr:Fic family protein [Candidatus Limnocylindria bacterium]
MSNHCGVDAIGLAARVAELAAFVRAAAPSIEMREAFAALRLEEIAGSAQLAGAHLDRTEVRVLLERGRALGGHRLEDYLVVRGYAEASAWAATHASRSRSITVEDLRVLHRLALRGTSDDAGAWRTRNLPALPDGTVPPPYWMVPFETETAIGRIALSENDPAPAALASAIARLTRLRPFATANGRVARLAANLLAYRRGLPPLAMDARARRAYEDALRAADGRDLTPLTQLIGRVLVRGLERLRDAAEAPGDLRPLAAFAGDAGADALYKAAQRGRLRVVRRDGRLYTTPAWLDAYRA